MECGTRTPHGRHCDAGPVRPERARWRGECLRAAAGRGGRRRGSLPGDLHKLWRARETNTYHLEYGYSCMGYEITGGLGVKMAAPFATCS